MEILGKHIYIENETQARGKVCLNWRRQRSEASFRRSKPVRGRVRRGGEDAEGDAGGVRGAEHHGGEEGHRGVRPHPSGDILGRWTAGRRQPGRRGEAPQAAEALLGNRILTILSPTLPLEWPPGGGHLQAVPQAQDLPNLPPRLQGQPHPGGLTSPPHLTS